MMLRRCVCLAVLLLLTSCAVEPLDFSPEPARQTMAPAPTPAVSVGAQPDAPPLAMASWGRGIVLLDPASSRVVSRAATDFPVEDLVHDPWRDRWIAVEYEDGSANQISVWRTQPEPRGLVSLQRERVIETAAFCRVAAIPSGLLIFEDDGLQQQWRVTDARLESIVASGRATTPASFAVLRSMGGPRMMALSAREQDDGPEMWLIDFNLADGRLWETSSLLLETWSKQPSAPRLAQAEDGALVIAQVQEHVLRVAASHGAGFGRGRFVRPGLQDDAAVEDVARARDTTHVLVSGANELVSVAEPEPQVKALPGTVGRGSYRAMARMLAFDPTSGVLLIGLNENLVAYRADERLTRQWLVTGWRWPVALEQTR